MPKKVALSTGNVSNDQLDMELRQANSKISQLEQDLKFSNEKLDKYDESFTSFQAKLSKLVDIIKEKDEEIDGLTVCLGKEKEKLHLLQKNPISERKDPTLQEVVDLFFCQMTAAVTIANPEMDKLLYPDDKLEKYVGSLIEKYYQPKR